MQSPVLTAVEVLVLLFLPGVVSLLAAFHKGKVTSVRGWSEFFFLSFLTSFCLSSVLGLVLAQMGFFSVGLMAVLALVYSLLIIIIFRPDFRLSVLHPDKVNLTDGTKGAFILLAILLLAGLLFFRPVEYIFGGLDPGVYANTAVHLARTGSIVIEDPLGEALSPQEKELFSRRHKSGYLEKYPGFRLSGLEESRIIPQFYHLFPVWLAVFYSGGGLKGMFYLTPVLGLLSLLAVYFTAYELWDKKVALVAIFLLAVNLLQIWQARFPTSEMLSQFLLFSGIFVLARYLKREEKYLAGLAGVLLGIFMLSRVSALLILIPLIVFFYFRWFISFQRKDLSFWVPLLILTAYSIAPNFIFGFQYFSSAVSSFIPRGIPGKAVLVFNRLIEQIHSGRWLGISGSLGRLLLFPAIAMLIRMLPRRRREYLFSLVSGKVGRWIGCGVILSLIWFGYFIRPYLGAPNPDKTNLVELGWLLSPLGLLLGSLGLFRLILKNRQAEVWLFLLIVSTFSGLFLWQQMIHYVYIWAARRYAVAVVPGFLLFASWLIVALFRNRRAWWLAPILLILIVARSAYLSRPLWEHREYRGAVDFMENVASRLKNADLVVVGGEFVDKIPTVLDLTYGYNVFPLYRDDTVPWPVVLNAARHVVADDHPERDHRIYFLTSGTPPSRSGLGFKLVDELPYHSILLERRADRLPHKLDEDARDGNFTVRIYRVFQRQG